MLLDESRLRRPTFVAGEPVVLADGQAWQLRRPLVRFAPADTEAGYEIVLDLDGDDAYTALTLAYESAEGGAAVLKAELALARAVLLANYDLTPTQVARLLRFGLDPEADPDGCRMRDEVIGVATGRGKGLSDAGAG